MAIMRPSGEVVAEPFEVSHTDAELKKLACFLEKLPGETRIVMEYTGSYWQPIAKVLHDAGLFVSVVNALLIYKYGNNSIRKGKTDKLDAVKIANCCLDRWSDLECYAPADQIRQTLKTCRRQYDQYINLKVNLKNKLILLLDGTFPGINTLFKSAYRDIDGHEKWVDFAEKFWHCECVCGSSEKAFTNQYRKWCDKAGYRFSMEKAVAIYTYASSQVNTLPMIDAIKCFITHAVAQLNTIIETIPEIQHEMLTLASQLPEYPIVMRMFGVGPVLGPQLMAEIGDVRRFHRKQFAGVDAPPCQSGTFKSKNRHISKRGSPRLRKTLFQVMSTIIQHAPTDDPVFQFLDRKRQEGNVYMTAAANKFLRIYYGTVMAYLEKL